MSCRRRSRPSGAPRAAKNNQLFELRTSTLELRRDLKFRHFVRGAFLTGLARRTLANLHFQNFGFVGGADFNRAAIHVHATIDANTTAHMNPGSAAPQGLWVVGSVSV